jgi:hypothetical protein
MTLRAHLDLLTKAAELETLQRTCEPLQTALRDLNEIIEKVDPTKVAEEGAKHLEQDIVLDPDDQEFDEALIGVAFVACQAGMTHVASRALRLAAYCKTNGIPALGAWTSKEAVYNVSEALAAGGASQILFVNAVANYFKHRDEWEGTTWANMTGQAKKTIGTISHGGLSEHSMDNLRKAVDALGGWLFDPVAAWTQALVDTAEMELATHL